MTPQLALLVFAVLIGVLFRLDREVTRKTSAALWIPIVWLLIGGSRPVSQWVAALTGAGGGITEVSSSDLYQDGSPLDRNCLIVLLALALIVLCRRGKPVAKVLSDNWAILAFFIYGGVSVVWSDYPDVAIKRWIKVAGNLLMIFLIVTDVNPVAAIKRVLSRTGFILIPISVLLIKYFPDLGRGYHPWEWTPYYTGVTTNKNELGMVCLTFGLASMWRVLSEWNAPKENRPRGPMAAHMVILCMLVWLFHMANSMTSLSCFLMATGLMAVMSSRSLANRRATVHVFVAAILAVAASALFLNIGSGLVATLGRDPTLTGRTEIWGVVLNMTENPLLGAGFESFWLGDRLQKIWSLYWWHPNEAHNGYIELYLNLGWIGIGLLAAMIVVGYRNVIRVFRTDPDSGKLRLGYFISAIAYNFTEAGFRMICPVFTLFLLTITSLPVRASVENAPCRKPMPTPIDNAMNPWWQPREQE